MALAAGAERARLAPSRRTRILAESGRPESAWSLRGARAPLAAAALLVVLALPAALLGPGGTGTAPAEDPLQLDVSLAADGTVLLEWDNGKPVHTVRIATSAKDLAKVNGIEVAGRSYQDASRSGSEIVYYHVD
ncbi:MAG TPA: hypothetical protein VJV23_00020 [Candidatus Polarisedimenticolia bacterium]|nr:hypothetical protein [Candidatus Polarisedimenticolia bacterium]